MNGKKRVVVATAKSHSDGMLMPSTPSRPQRPPRDASLLSDGSFKCIDAALVPGRSVSQ